MYLFMENVNLVRVSISQFNIFADVKLIECEKLIYWKNKQLWICELF